MQAAVDEKGNQHIVRVIDVCVDTGSQWKLACVDLSITRIQFSYIRDEPCSQFDPTVTA